MVAYNNTKYYIDIIETNPSNAVSIIETDYEVDFSPPLDYKEPEKPLASASASQALAEGQEAPELPLGPKTNDLKSPMVVPGLVHKVPLVGLRESLCSGAQM